MTHRTFSLNKQFALAYIERLLSQEIPFSVLPLPRRIDITTPYDLPSEFSYPESEWFRDY